MTKRASVVLVVLVVLLLAEVAVVALLSGGEPPRRAVSGLVKMESRSSAETDDARRDNAQPASQRTPDVENLALHGAVIGIDGTPRPNVRVACAPAGCAPFTTSTNETGSFLFTNVPDTDKYALVATSSAGVGQLEIASSQSGTPLVIRLRPIVYERLQFLEKNTHQPIDVSALVSLGLTDGGVFYSTDLDPQSALPIELTDLGMAQVAPNEYLGVTFKAPGYWGIAGKLVAQRQVTLTVPGFRPASVVREFRDAAEWPRSTVVELERDSASQLMLYTVTSELNIEIPPDYPDAAARLEIVVAVDDGSTQVSHLVTRRKNAFWAARDAKIECRLGATMETLPAYTRAAAQSSGVECVVKLPPCGFVSVEHTPADAGGSVAVMLVRDADPDVRYLMLRRIRSDLSCIGPISTGACTLDVSYFERGGRTPSRILRERVVVQDGNNVFRVK